jgi:hypothetical protein
VVVVTDSNLTSTTIKRPLTNQMHLISDNQWDA